MGPCADDVLDIRRAREDLWLQRSLDQGTPNATRPILPFTLKQLHFASGSLAQLLNVSYTSKVASSNADDVEGILYQYIPSGQNPHVPLSKATELVFRFHKERRDIQATRRK
jgi:hypothetical protein